MMQVAQVRSCYSPLPFLQQKHEDGGCGPQNTAVMRRHLRNDVQFSYIIRALDYRLGDVLILHYSILCTNWGWVNSLTGQAGLRGHKIHYVVCLRPGPGSPRALGTQPCADSSHSTAQWGSLGSLLLSANKWFLFWIPAAAPLSLRVSIGWSSCRRWEQLKPFHASSRFLGLMLG